MDYNTFKKKLFGENHIETVRYSNEDLAFQIAYMLKKARLIKNITQSELADKIGTQQAGIARAESGSHLPSLSFLVKIADAMDAKLIMPTFDFLAKDSDLDFYKVQTKSYEATFILDESLGENMNNVALEYNNSPNPTKYISFNYSIV